MKRLALMAVVLALLAGGCEFEQYDSSGGNCTFADGTYEVEVWVTYDTDKVPGAFEQPDKFIEACNSVRGTP